MKADGDFSLVRAHQMSSSTPLTPQQTETLDFVVVVKGNEYEFCLFMFGIFSLSFAAVEDYDYYLLKETLLSHVFRSFKLFFLILGGFLLSKR